MQQNLPPVIISNILEYIFDSQMVNVGEHVDCCTTCKTITKATAMDAYEIVCRECLKPSHVKINYHMDKHLKKCYSCGCRDICLSSDYQVYIDRDGQCQWCSKKIKKYENYICDVKYQQRELEYDIEQYQLKKQQKVQ